MVLSESSRAQSGVVAPIGGLFLFAIAAGYLMSLLPLSLLPLDMPEAMAAWLASSLYGGLLLGAMFIEPLVKKIGHRWSLILSLAVLVVTIAVMWLLPYPMVWLGMRLLAGIATAGVFVVVESWLLLVEDERKRGLRLGLYMTALYGGNALGQLLIGQFGFTGSLPFGVVMGLMLSAIVPVLVARNSSPPPLALEPVESAPQVKRVSISATIGCLISGLLLGPMYGLMPVYLHQQPLLEGQTGLMMALMVVGGMAVQPLGSWLSSRIGKALLMSMFSLVGALSAVLMVQAQSSMDFGVAMVLLGAAAFVLYPIAINQACEGVSASKIVRVTQLMLLSYSVGSVTGPLLAQGVTHINLGMAQYLGIIFLATALYMLIAALKKIAPVMQPPKGME